MLYRAVTRDADYFPELGRQYQMTIAWGGTGISVAYRRSIFRSNEWTRRDAVQDAATYEGTASRRDLEEALHNFSSASSDAIEQHAMHASKRCGGYSQMTTGNSL